MKLATDQDRTSAPTLPAIIFEAIVTRRCVTATYNRMTVTLAPHIIYTRNDALYVGAVTMFRDGQVPREEKAGAFKLDGLVGLTITEQGFERSAVFDPNDEKFAAGVPLMMVEG